VAGFVFSLGYRATCRFIWDPSIDFSTTSNLKERRFVMSPFETLEYLRTSSYNIEIDFESEDSNNKRLI